MNSKSPREIVQEWTARLYGDAALAGEINTVFKLVIEGQTGGTWIFNCVGEPAVREGDGPGEVLLQIGVEDFCAIADGRLNSQAAFLEGRIRLSGAIEKALSLHLLLGSTKGAQTTEYLTPTRSASLKCPLPGEA